MTLYILIYNIYNISACSRVLTLLFQTDGFSGIGFTEEDTGMANSYVVATNNMEPTTYTAVNYNLNIDEQQTITDASATRVEGVLTMEFTRCLSNGSPVVLNLGENTIIWAFDTADSETPNYHGNNKGRSTLDLSLTPTEGVSVDTEDDGSCACVESSLPEFDCMAPMAAADADTFKVHWKVAGNTVNFAAEATMVRPGHALVFDVTHVCSQLCSIYYPLLVALPSTHDTLPL